MSNRLRYGVIGTGMMGVEHITNLLHLPGAEVTAISDPHARSRDWAQLAVGLDNPLARFDSHQELLASGLCDAVVIASPNHTHHEVLVDVLRTPHHVMVEKPLCTTVADCRDATRVADETAAEWPQRVVWMGLEYRYMPPTQAVVREVRDGAVGNLRMVAIREYRFPFLVKVGNWNRFSRNTGGTLDLCMFAEASKNEQEISVVGDTGKVEAMVTEGVVRVGRRADGLGRITEHAVHDDGVRHEGMHHGASYLEHVAFMDAIRTGAPAAVTLHDGLMSVAVGQAAHRSIDEGRPVTIEEVLA